jgi:pimeloyl-ACP methyl ester carboxylesterase
VRRLLLLIPGLLLGLGAFDYLAPHTTAPLLLRAERARCGLATRHVRTGDLDIAYLEGGTGAPLILVHGFGADKDNFARVSAHLTQHYRVLIPDLPGFGESSRPEGASYTIAYQMETVRAFARAVGAERPHLGGNSMGGFIVTEYALAYPQEVSSLWLLAPAGTRVAFDSELTRRMAETGENPLVARTPEEFARTIDFVMAARPFMPHSIRLTMGERAAADYPLHVRIFQQVGPGHVATLDDRLRGLATPTLVVWGKSDRALNPAAADVYRTAMPNAQVILMDGIGHLPMLEAPAQAAEDYLRFRSRVEGVGA